MKLWDKGFSTDKKVDYFTVGNDREWDLYLAKYDVKASKAHAQMLAKVGLISTEEGEKLSEALDEIGRSIDDGKFTIEEDFEDMHSKIEFLLTEKLGDIGKKIHTARSRNDQVLVALHLFFKDEIIHIQQETKVFFDLLLKLSNTYKEVLLPGYTHLQIAMPSSFGLWFSGYAESLIDDMYLLNSAYKVANQNPLGSAAGYGSSFPIDRDFTTKKMGFEILKYNVTAAQMSRGKTEKIISFAISSIAATLSKMAMDICLYMSQNFDFIKFPNELTTGSSIMPHKKNPDVFELIRAKCNHLQAVPSELMMITTNLPSGYQRDFQLTKAIILPAISELKSCLEMITFALSNIQVNKNILSDDKYDFLFSVDTLNKEVIDGMPFRDAYKKLGKAIEEGTYKPYKQVHHTHKGSIGNLCLQEIKNKMDKIIEEF